MHISLNISAGQRCKLRLAFKKTSGGGTIQLSREPLENNRWTDKIEVTDEQFAVLKKNFYL